MDIISICNWNIFASNHDYNLCMIEDEKDDNGSRWMNMEEIKVNEYIRTKEGNIFKITNYGLGETSKGDVLLVELNKDFEMEYCNLDIVKHSFNIIDLVEERRLFRWCKS